MRDRGIVIFTGLAFIMALSALVISVGTAYRADRALQNAPTKAQMDVLIDVLRENAVNQRGFNNWLEGNWRNYDGGAARP